MPATTNPDISAAQMGYLQALQSIIADAQADGPTAVALAAIQAAQQTAQPTQLAALRQAQQEFYQACQRWGIAQLHGTCFQRVGHVLGRDNRGCCASQPDRRHTPRRLARHGRHHPNDRHTEQYRGVKRVDGL